MRSNQFTAMMLSFLMMMTLISEGAADESARATSEEAIERRNVFTFFGGSAHDGAEQGGTIGLQYEYRLTKLFGFGGFGEYLGGDFDTWSVGTPVYFHPYAGWIIRGAPAVEFEDSESIFAFQFGAGYEFLLSEKWGFAPEIKLIYSEGGTTKMFYGVSVNWGFQIQAMICFPHQHLNQLKTGLIVGGEYAKRALIIDGKTVGYYRVVSGSVGFQHGVEAKDMILAFMTDKVLSKSRASKGVEAGIDGNVALITVGGGGAATTRNVNEPIVGQVFDVKGLMGDISLKGAKFSKIDPAQ